MNLYSLALEGAVKPKVKLKLSLTGLKKPRGF